MPEFKKCHPESPEEGTATKGKISRYRTIERGTERNWGRGKVLVDIVVVKGEKEKEAGTYVIKKFPSKEQALIELQAALDLREAGVPVPETIRYAELNGVHTLLYSDLTEGGKHEVWSQSDSSAELFYLELTEADLESIRAQTAEIAKKAAEINYTILRDSYFLRRKHGGDIEVIVGDLGFGIYKQPRPSNLKQHNQTGATQFTDHVRRIQGRVNKKLENRDSLLEARDTHFYTRLLPLTDGVRMITRALETAGHSHKEVVKILKGCGVGEDEELLTRPLEAEPGTKDLGLERLSDIAPTLADKIRSGDLAVCDLKRAATMYRYAKETDEKLKRMLKEVEHE